jgi:ribosome modulation factor
MLEIIDPMRKQIVYTEGKTDFAEGKRRDYNPYRKSNKELSSIWLNGWDQAKKDRTPKSHQLT